MARISQIDPTRSPVVAAAPSSASSSASSGDFASVLASMDGTQSLDTSTLLAPLAGNSAASAKAEAAITAGQTKMGTPYVWGGAGPNNFDCSGFVQWSFKQAGVSLPHYSGAQWDATTRITASQLKRGDLVFWGNNGSEHVAIYLGNNKILHTHGQPEGVTVTDLKGWWKEPSGYGRVK